LAVAIAAAAGWLAHDSAGRSTVTTDFEFVWRGTRIWAEGGNPYAMRPQTAAWPLGTRLFYPLPALMLVWPVSVLSLPVAMAVFIAVPSGILAWRLTTSALWPLLALASPNFVMAAFLGQWSPWLLAAMLWPLLGFVLVCKPTLGLACFVGRLSWRAALGCAVIAVGSIAVWPRWPIAWYENLATVGGHPPPLATPMGWLLALAALRWRRSDARLLLAMSCIPQLYLFADQLPLSAVVRTRREATLMFVCSWTCAAFWFARHFARVGMVAAAEPYVMAGCYLPALYIVLRRDAGPEVATASAQVP
jgi:hypothetical protein